MFGRDYARLMRIIRRHERRLERERRRSRPRTLTERQRAFIEAYLGDARGNASEAARVVGYRWPSKVGPELVYHPLVNPILHARAGLVCAGMTGPFRCGLLTFEAERSS